MMKCSEENSEQPPREMGWPDAPSVGSVGCPLREKAWHRGVLALVFALLVFRLVYTFVVPLDLVPDEAYYWDWSRRLDWGYYSKPPLVAWLIAGATQLAGSTTATVRIPAVILGTAGLYSVYLLGARMYGPKVGFFSALVCAATPGNAAMSLIMTIDAPLLFCWGISLYAMWRFVERGASISIWLFVAIAATGMGLLAKQTMVAALLALTSFLLFHRAYWRRLVAPGYLLLVGGSLAFLLPVLWWNAEHDWITFQHTAGHFTNTQASWLSRLAISGEFLLGQLGVVSPVTFTLVMVILAAAGIGFRKLGERERFLICFSGLPLVGVFCLSAVSRVQPNWPAAFYPAAIILMVAWAAGRIEATKIFNRHTALPRAIYTGATFAALAYASPFVSGALGLDRLGLDPVVRLRGWSDLGAEVSRALQQLPRPDRTFVVVTTGRATASELAFYLRDQPRVYLWNWTSAVTSQYDVWGGPEDHQGWDAAIITDAKGGPPEELSTAFETLELKAEIEVPLNADRSRTCRLWHAAKLKQWPDARRN